MSDVKIHKPEQGVSVTFTEAAKAHLSAYLAKQKGVAGVRISVKKQGCSGLSYVLDYVEAEESTDLCSFLTEKWKVFIDKASYPYLKGMRVDYVTTGLTSKLTFENPNQKGQCGCGESFTV